MKFVNSKLHWAVNNIHEHDSTAHNAIWHCLTMLSNLETVKAEIDGFKAESVIDGEKDFYQFMKKLYQNIYANPPKYAISTAEYDEHIKSFDIIKKIAENDHTDDKADAKESKLRLMLKDSIHFYPDFLYQLGLSADEINKKDYGLIISQKKYKEILKKLDTASIRKDNNQRLQALLDMGISVNETNEKYVLVCKQYQKMFLGLRVLCKAPENEYKYTNYLRLDYKRNIPDIEDIKRTLIKTHSEILGLVLKSIDNPKVKVKIYPLNSITPNHKWKVEYILNSKRIFEFYAGPAYLLFHIFFRDTESLSEAIKTLYKNDQNLFKWLDNNFKEKLCDCPRNITVMFGRKNKRICGSTNQVEIFNPSKDDAKNCIALMKILEK